MGRSSTEAEYCAIADATSEVNWVCNLLSDLGVQIQASPVVYCDNIGANQLCSNPVFHSRMKHVAIDFNFIRNQVQHGALRVAHASSQDQLANALTKPLSTARFTDL